MLLLNKRTFWQTVRHTISVF